METSSITSTSVTLAAKSMRNSKTLYLHLTTYGSHWLPLWYFLHTADLKNIALPLLHYDCVSCLPSHSLIGEHLWTASQAADDASRAWWITQISDFWQKMLAAPAKDILFTSTTNIMAWDIFWRQFAQVSSYKDIEVRPIFTLSHQEDELENLYRRYFFHSESEGICTPCASRFDYASIINSMLAQAAEYDVNIIQPRLIWRDPGEKNGDVDVINTFAATLGIEDRFSAKNYLPQLRSYETLRFAALCLPPHFHEAGARLGLKPKLYENAYIQPLELSILESLALAEARGHFDLTPLSPATKRSRAADIGHKGNQELAQKYNLTEIIARQPQYPAHIDGANLEPLDQSVLEKCVDTLDKNQIDWLLASLDSRFRELTGEQQTIKSLLKKRQTPVITLPEPEYLASVLTLSYNSKEYIARNIESVIAQKCQYPVQHIIVDDGSDDNSQQIILRYASKYPHIKPVLMPRYPRYNGRHILNLFGECSTTYAALCDADDYFTDPLKLQKQIDFLEKYKECSICFHPVDMIYEDGSPGKVYPPENRLPGGVRNVYTIKALFSGNMMSTSSVMYRWIFKNGLPDWFDPQILPADWYWHLLHADTGLIGYLPERMSVYWRHKSSLFATADMDHIMHRKIHGLNELKTYNVINNHFKNKYYQYLSPLANGVLFDFMRIYIETGDDTLLSQAVDMYPKFGHDFFKTVEFQNRKSPK